jgi:hypothetical protein
MVSVNKNSSNLLFQSRAKLPKQVKMAFDSIQKLQLNRNSMLQSCKSCGGFAMPEMPLNSLLSVISQPAHSTKFYLCIIIYINFKERFMNTKTAVKKADRIQREPPLADQFAFSIAQAGRMCSLSVSSVLKEIHDGNLPHIRKRGRILILADHLKDYLNKEQRAA